MGGGEEKRREESSFIFLTEQSEGQVSFTLSGLFSQSLLCVFVYMCVCVSVCVHPELHSSLIRGFP